MKFLTACVKSALVFGLLLLAISACGVGETTAVGAADRHSLGAADAPVTLVAFDDYQ
jgi:hypothetical protein